MKNEIQSRICLSNNSSTYQSISNEDTENFLLKTTKEKNKKKITKDLQNFFFWDISRVYFTQAEFRIYDIRSPPFIKHYFIF